MDNRALHSLLEKHYTNLADRLRARSEGPDCPGFAALRRAAVGVPPVPEIENHLISCESCRRALELFREELPRPTSTRRRRLAWLAAPAGAALVVALAVLLFRPPPAGEIAYRSLLLLSRQPDLLAARAEFESRIPGLIPASPVRSSGDRGREASERDQPDGIAILPGDGVEFSARNRLAFRPPYTLAVEGMAPVRELAAPRRTAPPPPGGWGPGWHRWALTTVGGDVVGRGRFVVLGAAGQQLARRAERELASQPLRLAAVCSVLGLNPRARELVERELPRLLPEERAAARRRFGLAAPPRE